MRNPPPTQHEACGTMVYPKPFMRIFGLLWIDIACPTCETRLMLVMPDPGGV